METKENRALISDLVDLMTKYKYKINTLNGTGIYEALRLEATGEYNEDIVIDIDFTKRCNCGNMITEEDELNCGVCRECQ